MHENLKFTFELGPSSLSFLDTSITLPTTDDELFTSKVFRKATYTGLILNFSAVCPKKWKLGLIYCLLHRAYTISSNWKLFSDEVDFLKGVFERNGYPLHVFFDCVNKFLNTKYNTNSDMKIKDDGVETIFFIPFVGLPSVIFGKKLRHLFKKYYCIDVKIVYSSFKVKNYFSLKCHTPLSLMANVVYKFQCLRDANQVYIGKTMRHLVTRVKEHGHSSSAIFEHLKLCDICRNNFNCDCFKIIDHGKNNFDVTVKEALRIKTQQPSLNTQLFSQGASFVLKLF